MSGCHSPPPANVSESDHQVCDQGEMIGQDRSKVSVARVDQGCRKEKTYQRNYLHSAEPEYSKLHTGLCDPFVTMLPQSRSGDTLACQP